MMTSPLRLRRITNAKSGRAVFLSFTAGLQFGVVPGMADLPGTVSSFASTGLLSGAIVHAGVAPSLLASAPDLPCGLIVDLLGGTWLTTRPERREQLCSLEHAFRVGADAVLVTVGLGSDDESHDLRLCGQVVREASSWGLPVLIRIDTTQTDAHRQYSATLSGHGARIAYELGADMVIVNYSHSGPAFSDALHGVPIPVLLGGGPRLETDEALLDSVAQALEHGVSGVALSAPLFWRDGPTATLRKLAELVHG